MTTTVETPPLELEGLTGADVAADPETARILDQLAADKVSEDKAPVTGRRKRSGTSGAERARRAKADAPAGSSAPRATRPATTRKAAPKIAERMAGMYAMAGIGVSMVPTGPAVAGPGKDAGQSIGQVVGLSLVGQSEALGKMWEDAAKDDPRVREALEKLLAVSLVGQIITAHVPIVLAGLVAAGAAPPILVGHVEQPAA
jgi:hypothetical protein